MRTVVINTEETNPYASALDEAARSGRLERGKLVVMTAFGAGLIWGGALVRW